MKPAISFVLQLSPSTAYENLEAIASNLLDGLNVLLNAGNVKCSVYMDGPTLEALCKVAKPLMFGKIKNGVREGILEFLGGGFYDPMFPIFPEKTQSMQLDKHRKLLKKCFDVEPQGFFNSSLVWEMGMTSALEKAGFDYALVSEAAIQDALGRSTPISGWFTVEDKDSFMRIVPVADSLTLAIENDDAKWVELAEPYCRGGKTAVVVFDLPPVAGEIVGFFKRFVNFVDENGIQTWPVSYVVNQLTSEGPISYLVSAGRNLGLPSTAKTCREILIRRPEVNLLHKSFLNMFRRGKAFLEDKKFDSFCEKLLPVMSPIYYRDLDFDEGMQSLTVRQWGFRFLIEAARKLDKLMDFSGLRVEVGDYLLQGSKQLWVENAELACLLDYNIGGVLRAFYYKPAGVNLVNAWRDDGEPSLAFLDCLLPNIDLTATQIELALSGREYLLRDPYDFQIRRAEGLVELQLLEEQGYAFGDKQSVFHVGKTYEFRNTASEISVSYSITNTVYLKSKCFFGSIFEMGVFGNSNGEGISINGNRIKWDKKSPILYPEAKTLDLEDYAQQCVIHMEFKTPASVFIGSIFGATATAAPEVFQGIRVYPFWRMSLDVMEEKNFSVLVSVSKG